jgi:hypothetical protein
MRPPIIVRGDGDLMVFGSDVDAARRVEPIDVEDGVYRAWDSEGRILTFNVERRREPGLIGSRTVEAVTLDEAPGRTDAAQLREELISYLSRRDFPREDVDKLSLERLVSTAAKLYGGF